MQLISRRIARTRPRGSWHQSGSRNPAGCPGVVGPVPQPVLMSSGATLAPIGTRVNRHLDVYTLRLPIASSVRLGPRAFKGLAFVGEISLAQRVLLLREAEQRRIELHERRVDCAMLAMARIAGGLARQWRC